MCALCAHIVDVRFGQKVHFAFRDWERRQSVCMYFIVAKLFPRYSYWPSMLALLLSPHVDVDLRTSLFVWMKYNPNGQVTAASHEISNSHWLWKIDRCRRGAIHVSRSKELSIIVSAISGTKKTHSDLGARQRKCLHIPFLLCSLTWKQCFMFTVCMRQDNLWNKIKMQNNSCCLNCVIMA